MLSSLTTASCVMRMEEPAGGGAEAVVASTASPPHQHLKQQERREPALAERVLLPLSAFLQVTFNLLFSQRQQHTASFTIHHCQLSIVVITSHRSLLLCAVRETLPK